MNIPKVFTLLGSAEKIGVHDWELYSDGSFEYVDESAVGLNAGEFARTGVAVARAIVSQLEILDMLQNDVCVCGNYKPRTRSHCRPCFMYLPPEKGKALYRRFRQGYEAAFLDSIEYLISVGRTDLKRVRAAVPERKGT